MSVTYEVKETEDGFELYRGTGTIRVFRGTFGSREEAEEYQQYIDTTRDLTGWTPAVPR